MSARAGALALALAAALAWPAAGAGATVEETAFRYVRTLEAPAGGVVAFEPDGPLYGHTRVGLPDLRVLDAGGRQVPWRFAPPAEEAGGSREVVLLNRGTRNGRATALADLGRERIVHDRLELEIPAEDFVGRVVVLGSDDRETFTRLSTTLVYDLAGATRSRSTTVVYPRTDFRYLSLRATGLAEIAGARVVAARSRRPLAERELRSLEVSQREGETVVVADLGFARVPVDELRISSSTELYDRPVTIEGSNDGSAWRPLAAGRVFRFPDSVETSLALEAHHRYLRATIENGDDAPLDDLALVPLARPRTLLLQGGFEPPYRLLYGSGEAQAPDYDFAALPAAQLEDAREGTLGPEAANELYEPPADRRSFFARHPWALQGALALAAAVVLAGGLLALRRRP